METDASDTQSTVGRPSRQTKAPDYFQGGISGAAQAPVTKLVNAHHALTKFCRDLQQDRATAADLAKYLSESDVALLTDEALADVRGDYDKFVQWVKDEHVENHKLLTLEHPVIGGLTPSNTAVVPYSTLNVREIVSVCSGE